MIIANDNFTTIIIDVQEVSVVWDNLIKILIADTTTKTSQGLSIIILIMLDLNDTPS